jgi:soluble P-type ATPase
MTVFAAIPGATPLELEHLVLDLNGTVADRGVLIEGVDHRLKRLAPIIDPYLLSADTLGTLDDMAQALGVQAVRISTGAQKVAFVRELGSSSCVAIGNGANDAGMLAVARLGIAIIGPEGASAAAVQAADVVVTSISHALELLLDEMALASTLRE